MDTQQSASNQFQPFIPSGGLVTPSNLPEELRKLRQWVGWKKTADGKKVPKQPNGAPARTNDPQTWCSYDEASAARQKFDGVGFVFTANDPFCGVDLDDCRNPETGVIESWALEIIRDLNSYTEISPSGTGVHTIVKGKLPGAGKKEGRIEMYDAGRYFCMTGDVEPGIGAESIEVRDVGPLYRRICGNKASATPASVSGEDVEQLLAEAGNAHSSPVPYNGGSKIVLDVCPWGDQHSAGDKAGAAVIVDSGGLPHFKCHHDSCEGNHWEQFLEKIRQRPDDAEPPAIECEDDGPPAYPCQTIDGDSIGDLTRELTKGTFIPPQYVREIVKTVLGSVVNGVAGYPGEEDLHCRQFTHNVSTRGEVGKGQSWKRVLEPIDGALRDFANESGIQIINGTKFGSGEYMVNVLKKAPVAIARFDEMKGFWSKTRAQASILEDNLTSLFEQGDIAHGSFKNGEEEVQNISLSFVGDFTKSGFDDSFRGRGSRGSGYLSRGVYQYSARIPHHGDFPPINWKRVKEVIDEIRNTIAWVKTADKTSKNDGFRTIPRWIIPEDKEAQRLRLEFDVWLQTQDQQYTPRLSAHLKRDALLRGLFSPERRITAATMALSIEWCKNQLANRKALWPEDEGSHVSIMEQKILAALRKHGKATGNDLKKVCHVDRPSSGGFETFNRAIKALITAKSIKEVGKTRKGFPIYGLF